MKTCPFCAEEIQDEAIFCRYCNHDLTLKISQSGNIETESDQNKPVQKIGNSGFAFIGIFRAILGVLQSICVMVFLISLFISNDLIFIASIEWFIILSVLQIILVLIAYVIGKSTKTL